MTYRDYEKSGLTIQEAMLDAARSGTGTRPPSIRWGSLIIQTSDCVTVPAKGRFKIEFLDVNHGLRQGIDVRVNGAIRMGCGESVSILRTWHDPRYEDVVEYAFDSVDGQLWLWNVFEPSHPWDNAEAAKWTDNAGFWVETSQQDERTYHCSAGPCRPPDFTSLLFRLTVM